MQNLEDYLHLDGWKKDWRETKEDFSFLNSNPEKYLRTSSSEQKGGAYLVPLGCAGGIAISALSAYVGSYIGEGVGWFGGNIINFIPLANDVVPWLAERSDMIEDAGGSIRNINENFYQTAGAVSGFWAGLFMIPKIFMAVSKS